MGVTGWPLRAGRAAFGPTMRDERRTVDSEREINAEQANLSFQQLGGMGLIAPKAVMLWSDPAVAELSLGLFAWDQVIYQDVAIPGGLPSYLTYVQNGVGDYTVTFAASVLGRPDEEGVPQSEVLDFQFGLGDVNLLAAGLRGFVEITQLSPQSFNILTRRGGAASDQPYALALW